jgi:hypothetical protein
VLAEFPEGHPFQADLLRHAEQALRVSGVFHIKDIAENKDAWAHYAFEQQPAAWVPLAAIQRAITFVEYCWGQKKEWFSDIADDRFQRANPKTSVNSYSSLPEYMFRFVKSRQRKIEKAKQDSSPWTLREYYRYLHLTQNVAEHEVDIMMRFGYVEHCGARGKSNVFRFVNPDETQKG